MTIEKELEMLGVFQVNIRVLFVVLKESKTVSNLLQNASIYFIQAADLIEAIVEKLETKRNSAKATDYYQKSETIAAKNELKNVMDEHHRYATPKLHQNWQRIMFS